MAGGTSRITAIAAAVALLLMMAAGVAFARADQALRVAEDASDLRHVEGALAESSTFRANLAIAVVAAATGDPSTSDRAWVGAGEALDRMRSATKALGDPAVTDQVSEMQDVHRRVGELLDAGEVAEADRMVSAELLPLLGSTREVLSARSSEIAGRIEAEGASAGRLARVSSFAVALIAPALGLWAFRRAAKRRLEQERLQSELARQQDLARAQEELIAGLSHELRTPLTGIYGFAEALLDDSADPDPALVREGTITILDEANRLRRMVDDILVTARAQSSELAFDRQVVNLAAEVEAAVEPFIKVGSEVEVACEPVEVTGDRLRLRHVLRNLIDNALRHGSQPVKVVGRHRGGSYRLAVEDAGDGPGSLDGLFEAFVHGGEGALVTGSLGLGLSVARVLCEGMRIELGVERDDGVTRFVLDFASVEEPVEASAAVR